MYLQSAEVVCTRSEDCFKFVESFYKAIECRKDEMKCGKSARFYLEKLKGSDTNEVGVPDSKAYVVGR